MPGQHIHSGRYDGVLPRTAVVAGPNHGGLAVIVPVARHA